MHQSFHIRALRGAVAATMFVAAVGVAAGGAAPSVRVAVTAFVNGAGKSADSWVGFAVAQVCGESLARSSAIHVVRPEKLFADPSARGGFAAPSAKPAELAKWAREHAVDLIISGKYQPLGSDTWQVHARLVDAATGKVLAEVRHKLRKDSFVADVLAMQRTLAQASGMGRLRSGRLSMAGRLKVTVLQPLGEAMSAHARIGDEASAAGEAAKAYRRAVRADPKYAPTRFYQGLLYRDVGYTRRALAAMELALEADKNLQPAHCQIAMLLTLAGQFDDALKHARKALALDGNDAHVMAVLGLIYKRRGEYDKAVDIFERAIKTNPRLVGPYEFLGLLYRQRKQYDKAVDAYRQLIARRPKDPAAYIGLGIVYSEQGLHEQAIASFTKAVQLGPKLYLARYRLGLAYKDAGKFQQAAEALSQAVDLLPRSGSARLALAEVLIELGRLDEAEGQLRLLSKLARPSALLYRLLGLLASKRGDVKAARSYWLKSLELDANQPQLKQWLKQLGLPQGP